MPPKKDLDTSSQIDKIFDDGPDEEDLGDAGSVEDRSNDREIVPSRERTNERSRSGTNTGAGTSGPSEGDAGGAGASDHGGSAQAEEKDRLPGPYVPKALAWDLDEAQARLRRHTGEKLSQSLIIECALRICLQDYKERGEDSALLKMLKRRM